MSERLHTVLDVLWDAYGQPEGIEKSAASLYFYELQAPALDREALGESFCKFASHIGYDPWFLADQIADRLESFQVLAKTASDPQARELAQFYSDWAGGLEKEAGWWSAGRSGARMIFGGAKRTAQQAAQQGSAFGRKTTRAMRTQRRAKLRAARRSQAHARQQTQMQRSQVTKKRQIQSGTGETQAQLKARLKAKQQARGVTDPNAALRQRRTTAQQQALWASPASRRNIALGTAATAAVAAPVGYMALRGGGQPQPQRYPQGY